MTVAEIGEAAIVAWIRARIDSSDPAHGVVLGPGDDAAVLAPAAPLVVTMDAISAGCDWIEASALPGDIGHRAVAVNLSDLAAMGATPRWLLLGLELAPAWPWTDLCVAVEGALALTRQHGATLVGGDVGIRPGPTTWTITAIGEQRQRLLRRDGARPGDRVWLIGALGLAALGLRALQDASVRLPSPLRLRAEEAHRRPKPQVQAGLALAATAGVHAAIDVSDGLGLDAQRLAEASGVHLELVVDELPCLDRAAQGQLEALGLDWRAAVARGGDDYALLVCAEPQLDLAALQGLTEAAPRAIGWVEQGSGVTLTLAGRDASAELGGYVHGAA